MSENSTSQADDVNTSDSGFENALDDAVDSLLDNAVKDGTMEPAYDEQDTSTEGNEDDTEKLEGEDDDQADEDAENVDEDEDDATDDAEEDEDDDESTQDDETEEEEDGELDMEFEVPVKIDGEESTVTLEELIKGYQTNQSQTKKGQELAEQAKELKAEREKSNIYEKINRDLLTQQDGRDLALLEDRRNIMDKVAKGEYVEGVDDDLATLQYKYKSLEDEYNKRKKGREELITKMNDSNKEQAEKDLKEKFEEFQKEIPNLIPDWSDEIAQDNYKFAVEQGIPEAFVANIADPIVAKFIDDFRRLKSSASKGAVKRKKAPVKKVPTKKPVPNKIKKRNNADDARKRVEKGEASDKDLVTLNNSVYDSIFEDSKLF
ncbi:MAG: hypothetical protein H8D23_11765 [Candidatus Brocadiales bacterium]|nr:hypothetical protein [Candidatus Brocadiales bacterium]